MALILASASAVRAEETTPSAPGKAVYADAVNMVLRKDRDPPLTEAQKIVVGLSGPEISGMVDPPPVPADAPMPSADPRNFQGIWYHDLNFVARTMRDMHGKLVPFTMAGARLVESRVKGTQAGTPHQNAASTCRPPGPVWQADIHMPFAIYQSEQALEFVFMNYRGRWNLALDPKLVVPGRSYMGNAVAHWDGDTLVAETSGFKQGLWLDGSGTPVSRDGKLIERIRKIDFGDRNPLLEIETTVIDPKYYTAPWTLVRTYRWQPNLVLFDEYNCEEQIGDPNVSADAGLIKEEDN